MTNRIIEINLKNNHIEISVDNFVFDCAFFDLIRCFNSNLEVKRSNFDSIPCKDKIYIISAYYPYHTNIRDKLSKSIVKNKDEKEEESRQILQEIFYWYIINFAHELKKSEILIPMPGTYNNPDKDFFPQLDSISLFLSKKLSIPASINAITKDFYKKFSSSSESYKIKDKKVLIIEDVITSGNTLNECYQILKDLHAKEVNALVIGKTIHEKMNY